MWTAPKCRRFLSPLAAVLQDIRDLYPGQIWRQAPSQQPTKRALLIAINYVNFPKRYRLNGPQREVGQLKRLLITRYHYKPELITVLTDKEGTPPTHFSSKENILRYLEIFYEAQQPGDQYLFYFAGHSYQLPTNDPGEEDKKDEFLLPSVDNPDTLRKLEEAANQEKDLPEIASRNSCLFNREDGIVDDDLKDSLVQPLNSASRLTAILDTCHSNTLLDLPHHRCNRVHKWTSRVRRPLRRVFEMFSSIGDLQCVGSITPESLKRTAHATDERCNGYRDKCCRVKGVRNNIICLSACKDSQEVLESPNIRSMTSLLIDLLRNNPQPTLKEMMRVVSVRNVEAERDKKLSVHEIVSCFSRHRAKHDKREEACPQLSSQIPARMDSFLYL